MIRQITTPPNIMGVKSSINARFPYEMATKIPTMKDGGPKIKLVYNISCLFATSSGCVITDAMNVNIDVTKITGSSTTAFD